MDDGLKILIIMLISVILAYFIGSFFIVTFLGISPSNFDLGADLVFMFFSTTVGLILLWIVSIIVTCFEKIIEGISQRNIQ